MGELGTFSGHGDSGTMMEIFYEGGWVMWGLLALSIIALAVAIERWIVLGLARRRSRAFLALFEKALKEAPRIEELRRVAAAGTGPVARVASAGLRRFGGSTAQVQATLERHATREARLLARRLRALSTIATVAPLLGFLGTVTGMIFSFKMLADYGMTNPGAVAAGISEALITTAAGLVVAVPTQIAHNALEAWSERLEGEIEAVANTLLELKS